MRGCFFTNDGKYIYTLCSQIKSKSYIIKWKNNLNFDPIEANPVHHTVCTGMKLSENGK